MGFRIPNCQNENSFKYRLNLHFSRKIYNLNQVGATMQAVAKAKDKIKRFRRARSSTSVPTVGTVDDLPPPYSENPPVNPFYNEYLHSVDGGNVSLNSSRRGDESPGDGRPLVGSPLHPHQYPFNQPYSPLGHPPLYPLHLDQRTPTYQV